MTITSHNPSAPVHSTIRTPRPGRSNGQWKVDGHEPLNSVEVFKGESHPLRVRERIENVYSREGFDSITSDDLHGRFRWWGLYTQRRPGIDGGRTATLEPEELEDRYFMMRVRSDGAALNPAALRVLGSISTDFARGTADLTDRQNLQYHWVEIENVPEIWRRLESVGLQTTTACGDSPRGFLCSPVAGIAKDEIIDPTPVIREIKERWLGTEDISNLPRKFKTAVTGHPSLDVVHEINDVALVGVVHPELGPGYDVWVGGSLATVPRLGERLGAFATPEQAPEVWHGVVRLFRDYGYRRLRNKARLKFLLADWGPAKVREVLETEYLGYALADGPAPAQPTQTGDHVGVHEQKDGKFYVGAAPVVGRVGGGTLTGLADLIESVGAEAARFTVHQKIVILGVPADRVDDLVAGLEPLGLTATPSLVRQSTLACSGIEFCKLAIVNTKDTAAQAIAQLEERAADVLATLDAPIAIGINGCPNACARTQTVDIGLKGQLITIGTGDEAQQVPGFQVHLGGGLVTSNRDEPGFGRTVRGLKIPVEDVADYVERLVRRFAADREAGETFAQWAHRADEEALR